MAEAPESELQKWLNTIAAYDNEFKKWEARVTKILKRYRDDNRSMAGNDAAKFNILWANVQTLIPAVYARMPKADVSRRFSDNDAVGRVASLLIERALDYEIEHYSDFRATMRYSVEDRFLGGRGVAWVRYDPHVIAQEVQLTEDVGSPQEPEDGNVENLTASNEAPPEKIDYECSPTDYVHWKDFGHSSARTWEEVTQVWRWVYMTKEALKERFPDTWEKIPLDSGPDPLNKQQGAQPKQGDRAKICELWDKENGKVYWLSKSHPEIIDEKDDPLELEGFFPCARPLYATTTTDSLIPVPDFVLYQDQAQELDILSDRIDGLVKALRVRGVYDQSQPTLQRLLTEGDNNTLIPVATWQAFSEKGGLKGSIDLLPLDMISKALLDCYQARDDIKSQIYEITGIADILRGDTDPNETLGAQQIKGQYAGLRLRSMQESVAIFASELLRLKAQIICTKYQPETILSYAAASQMSEADQQLIPQALQLISQDPLRSFRIEVSADSLVQIDEQQNKQDRMEFLTAFGTFLREAIPAGQASPEMVPMLMEMAKYAVRGFKQARTIEGTIDAALEQLKQKAAQAAMQPPPPSPEMMQIQADSQAEQARLQADQQAAQAELQAEQQAAMVRGQIEMQVAQMRAQMEERMEMQRMEREEASAGREAALDARLEWMKAQLEARTSVTVAEIGAEASAEQAKLAAENRPEPTT